MLVTGDKNCLKEKENMNTNSVMFGDSIKVSVNVSKAIYFKAKRVFDIFVGMLGVLMMLPLAFIIKAVSIYNRDYDSIFFKQQRIGKNGKLFTMYKFRTMIPNADQVLIELMRTNPEFRNEYYEKKKVKNDPRITKIGKFLRKTSLDEVPQFLNVLLGDMSLVGNRPYLPYEKEEMGGYYRIITSTKPGLTGIWQVSGRSNTTFQKRLILEKNYSLHCNFKTDIEIIWKTIFQVFKKDEAE